MNLAKYIHDLLLENETVIIPGFGAFISNYKPAEINPETNEIKPPSKQISFNQKIRNNDGLLVGSVALGESVSHFDALKLIEKERENIVYQLDKGERVILDETGELFTSDENEILLHAFADENLLLDSFGLESVSLEKTSEIEEEIPRLINEPTESTPEPVIVEEISKSEPIKPEPKPIVPETKKEAPEESKSRGWLWILALIPIIFVGIYYVYQKSNTENPAPPTIKETKTKPAIMEDPVVVIDTLEKDSTTVLSEENLAAEDTTATPTEIIETVEAKFYLVGGSFKAEENAENYLIELKAKGLEPFHLGKRGNFYIVAIGAYQTEKEAIIAKQQFYEDNPKSGVWIMEAK